MWPASQGQYVLASQGQYCSWQCARVSMALAIFKSWPICSWQVWLVVQWVEAGLSMTTQTDDLMGQSHADRLCYMFSPATCSHWQLQPTKQRVRPRLAEPFAGTANTGR